MLDFLSSTTAAKRVWRDAATAFEPRYFWIGEGRDGLEVAYAIATTKPSSTEVRAAWGQRHGHSAAPLLLIVAYPDGRGNARAMACGPTGDAPRVADMDLEQAERLADGALRESNRHLAITAVDGALERMGDLGGVPGLVNRGLLATHELMTGVPQRQDWERATQLARAAAGKRDQDLVRALGFDLEAKGDHHVLRTLNGQARAVAVILLDDERPDLPSFRFGMQTPVSFALSRADRDNVPWVMSVRGGALRLYSSASSGAVGQRGRAETYVELDLTLLPSDRVAYLHLIFSAEALSPGGSLYDIQSASRDFTAGLATRLRERVYEDAVPRLAEAVARRLGGTSPNELAEHYGTALTILFRLLFIAYAEDSRLLPLHINEGYTDASLKHMAQRLAATINQGGDLGFDDPITGHLSEHPDATNDDLWQDCLQLFRAVDQGHARWGIPAYNGGLFSGDPSVNADGARIRDLTLPNAVFGPVLLAITVDRAPDDSSLGPIDFRSLSVREFGTIYEGLLESELSLAEQDLALGSNNDYVPAREGDKVEVRSGAVYLHNASGQRKSTGSYFTKPFAVDHLLDHALDPTLDTHLERVKELVKRGDEASAAELLFDFRVADISMGSGHFLTAVVDRIEARISDFLTDNPVAPLQLELDRLRKQAMDALGANAAGVEIETSVLLRRLIARRCVYGVDLNPISVELARVSMWIHTFVPGLPLSFLDHNLITGDSLTGIGTLEEALGVLQRRDKMQDGVFNSMLHDALDEAKEPLERLAMLVDATPKDVAAARKTHAEVRAAVEPVTALLDLTVAVRLGHVEREALELTGSLDEIRALIGRAADRAHAREMRAVHFPIAFPEVFLRERPGFDVIVSNPPWEKAKFEEDVFWGRHFPGFRSKPQAERERLTRHFNETRPDLAAVMDEERASALRLAQIVKAGPYDIGSGDTELSRVFAWRFWHLVCDGGRFGVVVPRQAILAAPGMKVWRETILNEGAFDDVTLLTNRAYWAFDGMEQRYTIGLVTVRKQVDSDGYVRLSGPYRCHAEYVAGQRSTPEVIRAQEFSGWGEDLMFPTLQGSGDVGVFRVMMRHRSTGQERSDWQYRPVRDADSTMDKPLFTFSDSRPEGAWPVYAGSSFNLWIPDTGTYYAWIDASTATQHLFAKRRRQASNSKSAFHGLPQRVLGDSETLPCLAPRIAFRKVSRATDSRTIIAALVPPNVVLQDGAPYLLRTRGTPADDAYLLGCMSSRILDWVARRTVEVNVTFTAFNMLPVPTAHRDHPGRQGITQRAGRLAAIDDRYADWAAAVGVEYGPVPPDEAEEMKVELDACVARLYGLEERQIRDLFATFHPTWDHEPWTERVLEHFRAITWDPAEVPA